MAEPGGLRNKRDSQQITAGRTRTDPGVGASVVRAWWFDPHARAATALDRCAAAHGNRHAFVVYDGESIWIKGLALIGLYRIIAAAFWWE